MRQHVEAHEIRLLILVLSGGKEPLSRQAERDFAMLRKLYHRHFDEIVKNTSIDERHFVAFGIRFINYINSARMARRKKLLHRLRPSAQLQIQGFAHYERTGRFIRSDHELRDAIEKLIRDLGAIYDTAARLR